MRRFLATARLLIFLEISTAKRGLFIPLGEAALTTMKRREWMGEPSLSILSLSKRRGKRLIEGRAILNGQFGTTFGAAAGDDISAIMSGHFDPETVSADAFHFFRLVDSFWHVIILSLISEVFLWLKRC